MGLLSRLAERGGRFAGGVADGLGDAWKKNAPLGNAALGLPFGAMGAAAGAQGDHENPLRGAALGFAGGMAPALAIGGFQGAHALGRGLAQGIAEAMKMAPHSGPGFEAAKQQVMMRVRQMMQQGARFDPVEANAVEMAMQRARTVDELYTYLGSDFAQDVTPQMRGMIGGQGVI